MLFFLVSILLLIGLNYDVIILMGRAVVVNHGVKGLVDAIEVLLCDAQPVPLGA